MKALPTLIRIAKRDLDALRQALGAIEGKRAEISDRLSALEEEVASEQRIAMQNYDGARAYGGFAAAALTRKRAILVEAAIQDKEASAMRALVAEAHVELKKLERLMEMQNEREAKEELRRENAELDEMATIRAARAGGGA
ncbi:MAG: flagellar FliJ family protein [Caulobacterales bacterium]